jgi:acetoin utilization deacetylase AcuC-like enzyme
VGQGDQAYLQVMDEIFHLPIRAFRPELILISAGFDAHEDDPLGGMLVTDRGFADLAGRVVDWAAEAGYNRVAAVLEGGYDPDALGRSVISVLDALDGDASARYDGSTPASNEQAAP